MLMRRMEGGNGTTDVSAASNAGDSSNLISQGDSNKDVHSNNCGENEAESRGTTSHSSSSSGSPQRILETAAAARSLTSSETATVAPCLSDANLGDQPKLSSQSISTAALIASKQKLLQKENLRRVMNPPKLERKHSSGDLHSRLKTRKILGVGETDNGDIHRSKISQVLGHNEHLYVKFPRGVWNWQACLSAMLFVQAVLILFFPRQACQLKLLGIQQQQEDKDGFMMISKYYAVSLLVLSFTFWRFMFIRDKNVVRTVQLSALMYSSSLCAMDLIYAVTTEISHLYDLTLLTVMGVRLGTTLICSLYLSRIGNSTSGLRKSPSHKDLGESMKKEG